MRYALPVVGLAILAAFLAIGLRLDPRQVPSPLIGKPAPAFALPSLDEDRQISLEDLKGRPVLVNFWASWCAGCRVEHPLLMRLAQEDGIEIVGMDYKDGPAVARAWLRRHGNPYRVIAQDRDGAVGLDWGVYGVPETYLLSADGRILFKQIGPMTQEAWEQEIRPLMQEAS
ncbi:MAG: DsbE family thiol:disulfide interchange protein [Panacagrimonas sp.]